MQISEYNDFVTVKEACSILNVSRPTLYKLISENCINGTKVRRDWRISKDSIIKYLNK